MTRKELLQYAHRLAGNLIIADISSGYPWGLEGYSDEWDSLSIMEKDHVTKDLEMIANKLLVRGGVE